MSATPRWHVYMIRCADGALYTGVATDVSRRLEEHRRGGSRAARYLRGRAPLRLVACRAVGRRSLALRIEIRIKRLPKSAKEELVTGPARLAAIVAEVRRRPAPRRPAPRGRRT